MANRVHPRERVVAAAHRYLRAGQDVVTGNLSEALGISNVQIRRHLKALDWTWEPTDDPAGRWVPPPEGEDA